MPQGDHSLTISVTLFYSFHTLCKSNAEWSTRKCQQKQQKLKNTLIYHVLKQMTQKGIHQNFQHLYIHRHYGVTQTLLVLL